MQNFLDASLYGASELVNDLSGDMSWLVDSRKDIVLGWVDFANHNGEALDYNAHFAVCACSTTHGIDWPHDSIAQHETSHLFGAVDHTSITPCIMDYWDAYWGVDVWCGDCYSCINSDIK
jgi:hypothetical protein